MSKAVSWRGQTRHTLLLYFINKIDLVAHHQQQRESIINFRSNSPKRQRVIYQKDESIGTEKSYLQTIIDK